MEALKHIWTLYEQFLEDGLYPIDNNEFDWYKSSMIAYYDKVIQQYEDLEVY